MTRIIAVGDSIANADRSLAWWISQATGADLDRVSRGGATAAAVVDQLELVGGSYSLAVLTVGTNDVLSGTAPEAFRDALASVVEGLRGQADRIVAPTIPTGLASFPGGRSILRARVDRINAMLRERDDVTLIDGDVELGLDRVHPTVAGQRAMAERALTALGLPGLTPEPLTSERPNVSTIKTAGTLAAKSLLRRW